MSRFGHRRRSAVHREPRCGHAHQRVLTVQPGEKQAQLAARLPWLADMRAPFGPQAYVCSGFSCQAPTGDPAELARQLEMGSAPPRIILA